MNKNNVYTELASLIKENPNLPVRFSVDEEIVTGEYSTYLADVHSVAKISYAIYGDKFYTDEDSLLDDWIYVNADDLSPGLTMDEAVNIAREATKNLWDECIMVHIVPPIM